MRDPHDPAGAALGSMGRPGGRFWLLLCVLAAAVLVGVFAYAIQVREGLAVAGYGDDAFWGIYEANLVAFIGVSYGGAVVSAILRLTGARWRAPVTRIAEAMALVSLLVGMAFLLVHLGRPDRFWMILVRPQVGSPLVWDFAAITTYLVATAMFLYLPLIPDLALVRDRARGTRARIYGALALGWRGLPDQRAALDRGILVMAILIIPLAVIVHSVLSWTFAVTGRPGWHSTIFAPYFVVAALYSGVAMVVLVVAGFRAGYRLGAFIEKRHFVNLGYLMVVLGLVYLYLTFSELLTEGYVMAEETVPVLEAVLFGGYAPLFWVFVLVGGVLPLLIIAVPRTRTVAGITTAAALVVVAMWLKRLLIVVPAVAHPLIREDWGAFHVTWVSVAVTIAGLAAIALLMMSFFKLVPILDVREMEELRIEPASPYTPAVFSGSPAE